jgi:hypothetical protein
MKKTFTLLAFVVTMTAMAQSVAISDDGSVADGSAILEVKSTTKVLTYEQDQRDAISAVAGLQIWCTDCGPYSRYVFFTMEVSGLLEELDYFRANLQLQITKKSGNHNRK